MASVLIPLVAVLCIAVVGVLSFTNVRDRQSEIGIFRAMGVTAGRILQVFLARAFLSGFLGSILGLGLLYFLGDTYKETLLRVCIRATGRQPTSSAVSYLCASASMFGCMVAFTSGCAP